MSKQVTAEDLVANIEQHIAAVKRGETITIVENGCKIAVIEPIHSSAIQRPDTSRRLQDVDPGPRPKNLMTDPAALIIEEREYERSGKKYGF